MFPLVDAVFWLVVPLGAEVGPWEGQVEGLMCGGMLLQKPFMVGLVKA